MMIVLLTDVFWSFVGVFAVCEFGQKMSNSFDKIEYESGQLRWYYFPIRIHQMMPTFIVVAQQPIELLIIESVSCDRITFKQVKEI